MRLLLGLSSRYSQSIRLSTECSEFLTQLTAHKEFSCTGGLLVLHAREGVEPTCLNVHPHGEGPGLCQERRSADEALPASLPAPRACTAERVVLRFLK